MSSMWAGSSDRDRSIDALRVTAVFAVVSGHWLVTAVMVDDHMVSVDSPLRHLPGLTPLTWLFQALAPFFCAAGFAAARARAGGQPWPTWFSSRIAVLVPPIGTLIAVWAVFLGVLLFVGFPLAELYDIGKLVVRPLWFLAVLAVLWAACSPLQWLDRRLRGFAILPPAAVVALADLVQYGDLRLGAPVATVLGSAAVICAWAVPFLFGIRLARGGGPGRVGGLMMMLAGVAAMAALILIAGYPASAVGVTGDDRSNLAPPSLLVLALGVAQLGLFVLVRRPSRSTQSRSGRILTVLNAHALPVFLWHQSALLLVCLVSAGLLPIAGLVGSPDTFSWVLLRLACFPALVLALLGVVRLAGPGRARLPSVGQTGPRTAGRD